MTEKKINMTKQELKPQTKFWQSLSKQQKWGLACLSILTIGILLLWFFQLKNNLSTPFYGGYTADELALKQSSMLGQTGLSDDELQKAYLETQDTDQDGLNDWDELNVHQTSPYLEDSDGDGVKDSDEIVAGEDPNCPRGEQCLGNGLLVGQEQESTSSDVSTSMEQTAENITGDQVNILKQVFGDNPSAENIRAILSEAGVSDEDLAKASDEELIKAYQEMTKETSE